MNPKIGRRTGVRASPAWSFAVAMALALGPAGCAGAPARGRHGNDPPPQPFQVRTVQRALGLRGFRVQPTGEQDEPTRAAVAEFQASKGLPRTGEIDRATARELGVSLDPMYNCETYSTVDCSPTGD